MVDFRFSFDIELILYKIFCTIYKALHVVTLHICSVTKTRFLNLHFFLQCKDKIFISKVENKQRMHPMQVNFLCILSRMYLCVVFCLCITYV